MRCAECHTTKWPVSRRIEYLGLASTCVSCHAADSPHAFTKPADFPCERCHGEDSWKRADPSRDFDHDKDTDFPLTFKHATKTCKDCHGPKVVFGELAKSSGCARCHRAESPHKNLFREHDCVNCHVPKAFTVHDVFDHAKETRFPLTGGHAGVKCAECHVDGVFKPPSMTCKSCHLKDSKHGDRFDAYTCADCHRADGWKAGNWFDHAGKGGWKLTGSHARAACRDCHRGADPAAFERFKPAVTTTACKDCHRHAKAHEDEPDFLAKPCLECHLGGGIVKLKYDPHEGSPFHKSAGHAKVGCDECHAERGYTGLTRECARCHAKDDVHEGALGSTCEKCHGVPLMWAAKKFVHDIHADYKLEGKHVGVACKDCHADTKHFKPNPKECVGCHREEDVHVGRLGDKCETCHDVFGKTTYDHAKTASFPISAPERHSELACAACHMDRRYKPTPSRCTDCHFDAHEGRYGATCESCHQPKGWMRAAPIHTVGPFTLAGAHDALACARCHTAARGALAGTGELCFTCHRDDDIHENALGPECGDCHTQWSWLPSTWSHADAGFALTGAHRFTACDKCHAGGVYGPLSNACEDCHTDDFMRILAFDPGHPPNTDCASCHFTTAWRPWRRIF